MTKKQSISFIQMPPTQDFYIRCQECCDWLNNLIKENKQLKQKNEELKHQLSQQEMEYATTAYRQAEENEQLKKLLECSREEANDYCEELMEKDEFVRLYKRQRDDALKENKQLKSKIQQIKTK